MAFRVTAFGEIRMGNFGYILAVEISGTFYS